MLRVSTTQSRIIALGAICLALLFGQSGGLIVAALCPHLNSDAPSCDNPTIKANEQHHGEEQHHDMGHSSTTAAVKESGNESGNDAADVVLNPEESCSHCAVHSGTSQTAASLQFSNFHQRTYELVGPLCSFEVHSFSNLQTASVPSRAHGPPIHSIPTHVLISVFRI